MTSSKQPDLPYEKLPDSWKDEARINVLYAPFRSRQVNPKDWDNKLEFWKQSMYAYCTHNHLYCFKLPVLQKVFLHNGRIPMCLEMVFEEMIKNKEIVPLEEFLLKPSNTWSGWAADVLVKKPMRWSFDKVKQSLFAPNIAEQTFVHVSAIRDDSKLFLSSVPDNFKNRVIEFNELYKVVSFGDKENLKLVLHCAEIEGEVSTKEIKSEGKEPIVLVKVGNVKNKGGIKDSDVDVYMLSQTEKILLSTVEQLENEIEALIKEVKGHLVKGHKQLAKSCLRKKRDVEKRIEARANALHNVQTLLSRVEDAAYDVHVLETYKFALNSLRTNFKENKMSEESVTNTMIEIGDALDIHNEIQESLAHPVVDVDADLEAELQELLAADENNVSPKPSNTSPKTGNIKDNDMDKIADVIGGLDLPDVPDDEERVSTPVLSVNT